MINYLAVALAAVLSTAVGFVWYGPLFGKTWIALVEVTPEQIEKTKAKGDMRGDYTIAFVGTLLMSYVLARLIVGLEIAEIIGGLKLATWTWLGFIAPITLGRVLWGKKPWKLWFLDAGYYLAALLIMGAVLAGWR